MSEKNNGDRLSRAMSGISEKMIGEAAECTPEKVKKQKFRRTIAISLAAVILVSAIPLGILLKNRKTPETPASPIPFSGGKYSGQNPALPPELKTVSITASSGSGKMVPVDGSFILETEGDTDAETVAEFLSVTPEFTASITKLDSKTFKIQPASGTLAPGSVYKLALGDPENPVASFAFQTESFFAVKSVFPGDLGFNVPVDTGIEVTFTEAVKLEGKPFTLSPAVKGSYSLYPDGRTVLFLPEKKLAYDTVYTLTVSAEVTGQSGKTLGQEVVSKFRTVTRDAETALSGTGYSYLGFTISSRSTGDRVFSPGDNAFIRLNLDAYNIQSIGDVKVSCDLYAFRSAGDAVSAIIESEKHAGSGNSSFDLSKLKRIGSFDTNTERASFVTVDFGTGLPGGTYLAVFKASARDSFGKLKKAEISVPLQISTLRAYTVSSDGSGLLWLNRDGSGPVSGARAAATLISRNSGWDADPDVKTVSIVTDRDGLAAFENEGSNSAVILVESGDESLIVCAQLAETDVSDYMMSYIYTDRAVYFPDDTVNFFGFLSPSFGGSFPDHLWLETGLSNIKTRIEVSEQGFFKGSLTYTKTSAGYYSFQLTDDSGRTVAGKGFRITEESKPQYTASISFDRLYYRRGDKVKVTVTASFFDGTPVEGLEFYCTLNYFGDGGRNVKTDKNGKATATFTTHALTNGEVNGTYPVTLFATAELVGYETQKLVVNSSTIYFNSDYSVATLSDDNSFRITGRMRDFSKLQTEADLQWPAFPDNTNGEPLNKAGIVNYSLIKVTVVKARQTEYDSYTKRQRTYYTYSTYENTIESGEKSFVNGEITLPLVAVSGFEGWYYYRITFYDDSTGDIYVFTGNATKGRNNYYRNSQETGLYEQISLNAEAFAVGDRVAASLLMAEPGTKSLFIVSANGIAGYVYAESYEFNYTDDMIAAGSVYAVTFDKSSAGYSTLSKNLRYDIDRASLSPEITTSAAQYRPGDRASVTVKVPGATGGYAIVSIVDEACFALGDQDADPSSFFRSSRVIRATNAYYMYYYDGYYYDNGKAPAVLLNRRFDPAAGSRNSLTGARYGGEADQLLPSADAENAMDSDGSNGDDTGKYTVRKYFADNPEFSVIELDSEGTGTLVFTVPDNITSWRITALAVSGAGSAVSDIRTGAAVSDVVCTLPFFINLGICDKYIVGDTISLSARAYGSEAEGNVKYTAVFADSVGNTLATVKASADSKERCWLKFNTNEPGSYSVTVYAECGANRDALTETFDVLVTAVAADISRTVTPDELKTIDPVYYPVRIVFSNRTVSFDLYERVIGALSFNRHSGRSDEYAALWASSSAAEALYGYDGAGFREELISLLTGNNFRSGLFSLFPYGEGDALLTAEMISLDLPIGSSLSSRAVSTASAALSSKNKYTPEQLCSYLAILAASGEPVLDTLCSVASRAGGWSDEAKLILAFAFATCGDYPAAHDIYSLVYESCAVEDEEFGTLRFGDVDIDTEIRLTSLALLCASRIDRPDASKLALWLLNNRSDNESSQLALASYLKYFLPAEKEATAEFTYSVLGKSETVVLETGRSYLLSLSKQEFDSLEFDIPANISIGVSYKGSAEEALAGSTESGRVTITKTLEPLSNGTCLVTLNISGKSTHVSESFSLCDLIPSGARFLALSDRGYSYSYKNGTNCWGSIYNRSGQNMSGWIQVFRQGWTDWKRTECPEYSFSLTISYMIRGGVDGDFVVESAFLKSYSSDVFAVSKRMKLTISEKGNWKVVNA